MPTIAISAAIAAPPSRKRASPETSPPQGFQLTGYAAVTSRARRTQQETGHRIRLAISYSPAGGRHISEMNSRAASTLSGRLNR